MASGEIDLGLDLEDLDITNPNQNLDDADVDFEEIDVLMSKFHEDPSVKEALDKGIDMREYSRQIERDLQQVEKLSIDDYIKEAENLAKLHHQIQSCDTILERMESLLSGFQADLGNISDEIRYLQDQSSSMSVKLHNRKAVADSLTDFISEITVPPDLIKQICISEVNEDYLEFLTMLHKKISFSNKHSQQKVLACQDVDPQLEKLKTKAVTKIREFLLQNIYSLRKPGTNIQIIQQNKLVKFKYLNRFIYKYSKEHAVEIREAYVDTLQKIYFSYFRDYINGLLRFKVDIGSKNDLLAMPEGMLKGFFSDRFDKKRVNVFSMGDRAKVLEKLEDPYLVLHEAQTAKLTCPYEVLFRSMNHYFKDAVCSEYSFDVEFFGKIEMFQPIFGKSLALFVENLTNHLLNCYDALGILMLIRITQHNLRVIRERNVPCLIEYFEHIQQNLLWPRFYLVFNMHLESVKVADPKVIGGVGDIRPHYVNRRYAEFGAGLHLLNQPPWEEDATLAAALGQLRSQMVKFLSRLSHSHPNKKDRLVFLINNFDHVLSVFEERHIGAEGTQWWRAAMEKYVGGFVEIELAEYFGTLIQFVKETHPKLKSGVELSLDQDLVGRHVKGFAMTWKQNIDKIQQDVLRYFSNFLTGGDILKKVLTQLALHYSWFEEIIKQCFKPSTFSKEFVPTPTLTYQIKKCSMQFD